MIMDYGDLASRPAFRSQATVLAIEEIMAIEYDAALVRCWPRHRHAQRAETPGVCCSRGLSGYNQSLRQMAELQPGHLSGGDDAHVIMLEY